jgi:nitroreductase
MSKQLVSSEVIASAVHLASRAPSFHNSQPWRFVGEGNGRLNLHLDRDRLVHTDFSGRQAVISCGAVLDHLRVAMAAAGWTTNVSYYPDHHDQTHLASLYFSPMPFVTDAHRRRADAILARHTDRLPFSAPPDRAGLETQLRHAIHGGLAALDMLAEGSRPLLAEAAHLTEALRMYDSSYHAELDWWTAPFEGADGIPRTSLVSAAESDRVEIGRNFPVIEHGERRPQVAEDRSTVVVLSALGDTRRDMLSCGEALSATLLEATVAGLATCPLTHLIEVDASRDIIIELTGRPLPQVLVRVGLVPVLDETPPPTPRRPLTDVLRWSPAMVGASR